MGSLLDTYDCTTTSVTDHEVLARAEMVEICEMSAMNRGRFGLRNYVQTVTPRAITSERRRHESAICKMFGG